MAGQVGCTGSSVVGKVFKWIGCILLGLFVMFLLIVPMTQDQRWIDQCKKDKGIYVSEGMMCVKGGEVEKYQP